MNQFEVNNPIGNNKDIEMADVGDADPKADNK